MIRLRPSLVLLPLLLAASPAPALQVLEARDGDTVLGQLSRKELTRITVEGARIRKVTGNAGEFLLEKDDEKGQIFIRPASSDSTKPINLFVTTASSTVGLLLQPVDTPSDTIVIREKRVPEAHPAMRADRSSAHVRALKSLLLAMAGETAAGMEVRESGKALALWPGVRLTLERSWRADTVVGEKYQLLNLGPDALDLTERDLYKPGVMAISLEAAQLAPGASIHFFVIRERRAHD